MSGAVTGSGADLGQPTSVWGNTGGCDRLGFNVSTAPGGKLPHRAREPVRGRF